MIRSKNILFQINNKQYIKIITECPDKIFTHRFDPVTILFYDGKKKYILSEHDHLGPELETLNCFFKASINGDLELLKTIIEDLGYLYNEEIHNRSLKPKKVTGKGIRYYLMLDGNQNTTWLYTKNNSIFLQITPSYLWHFSDPEEHETFVSYDEFIKNYQSYLTVEIKKETMANWAIQSNEILQMIKDE
jgi:hypothetical protein